MFEVLEPRAWPAKLASAALHAGLVALAVSATRAGAPPTDRRIAEVPIHLPPPAPPALAAPPSPGAPRWPGLPRPVLPVFTVPPTIPPVPPLPPGTTAPDLPGFIPGSLPLGGDSGVGVVRAIPGIVNEREADEPPQLLTHPAPRYPAALRQAGIEGRVVIEAVLDAEGRAEPGSLRVVSSAHPLFAAEAERVVLASQYRPARVAGRAVRVRVAVPVSFTMTR